VGHRPPDKPIPGCDPETPDGDDSAVPNRDVRWGGDDMADLAKEKERAEALRGRLDELRGFL
jgi:hypothetical protein